MEDREFLDLLYQMWCKTTYAKERYWDFEGSDAKLYTIRAVGENGETIEIAERLYECDADFITAIHGCLPDLVRLLNIALDEAESADLNKDIRECRIAELECELAELKEDLGGLISG
jgi:hypothetical protein